MPIALDAKDVQRIEKEFYADSQVWDLLKGGASDVTEADFTGVSEVRINKMKGYTRAQYKRNADNARANITITKETVKLEQEDWMGYDVDRLDTLENAVATISNIVEGHKQQITIPRKDQVAVQRLLEAAFKPVTEDGFVSQAIKETITSKNALSSYDESEQYMTDSDIVGPFIMFASTDYYKALKNSDGVSKTFSTNETSINGINRKVGQLDGSDTIIQKVSKARLQVDATKKVNYILVPMGVCLPLERYSSVDLISADTDRNGYRDTVKGLDYFDAIVLETALPAIYVSYEDATPAEAPKA